MFYACFDFVSHASKGTEKRLKAHACHDCLVNILSDCASPCWLPIPLRIPFCIVYLENDSVVKVAQIQAGQLANLLQTVDQRVAMDEQPAARLGDIQVVFKEALDGEQRLGIEDKNINIISGLAKGVDSYAHIGTLSTVGKTIAVVGNGLDSVYPVENKELLYRILKKGGAIISEYPLGTRPEKMNFPARNRIISGMSKGVIVIEAKKKSGTLITVDFALEQGRDVYVIPGNINSVNSAGTNELIKQGAKLVTTYDEIEI